MTFKVLDDSCSYQVFSKRNYPSFSHDVFSNSFLLNLPFLLECGGALAGLCRMGGACKTRESILSHDRSSAEITVHVSDPGLFGSSKKWYVSERFGAGEYMDKAIF